MEARSGLMARIKHPADVFSGACTVGIAAEFRRSATRGGEGVAKRVRGEGRYFLKT